MNKKVLVTSRSFGKISSEPFEILQEAGYEVILKGKDFDQAEFEAMIPEYDALIIGAHEFPAEVMARCPKLKLICKHGVGVDNIPLDKAKEMRIAVCNVPGTNSDAVADLTFGLMLAVARNIVCTNRWVMQGKWQTAVGTDVCGKTLGQLGFGVIGKNMARRAFGFNMKVLVYDPYLKELPEEFRDYATLGSLEEVVCGCDFLSMHLPLNDETRNLIAMPQLMQMKKGAYIINCARGTVVNEKDLYEALRSGHLAGAAMDVSEVEPIDPANPLLTLDNVIVTPHIGMYSKEAIGAVSLICAQNVAALESGELRHRLV